MLRSFFGLFAVLTLAAPISSSAVVLRAVPSTISTNSGSTTFQLFLDVDPGFGLLGAQFGLAFDGAADSSFNSTLTFEGPTFTLLFNSTNPRLLLLDKADINARSGSNLLFATIGLNIGSATGFISLVPGGSFVGEDSTTGSSVSLTGTAAPPGICTVCTSGHLLMIVPEPGTLTLVGMGLNALTFLRGRRKT